MLRQSRSTIITSRIVESAAERRRAAAPLEAGIDDRTAGARDRLAGAGDAIGRRRRELLGRGRIGGDRDAAVDRALAQLPAAQRPRAVEPRRPHVGGPRRPLGCLQRIGRGEVGERLLDRMTVVRRAAVRRWSGRRRTAAAKRLVVDQRIPPAMHRDQQFPLGLGAALRHDAAHRMALDAGRLGVGAGGVLEVDQAALGLPGGRPGLLRREPEMVRQVLHDLARRLRLDVQAVQRGHALHGQLPALGRVALEGDARHLPLVVGLMAAPAGFEDRRIGDRDAFFGLRGRRRGRLRRLRGGQDRASQKKGCGSEDAFGHG